jgi:hypothetical protein
MKKVSTAAVKTTKNFFQSGCYNNYESPGRNNDCRLPL